LGLCLLLAAANLVCAQETLATQIDRLVALQTPDYNKLAAPVADDAEFLRRAWLDLTGSVPPSAEARAFLADQNPAKRAQVIDRLLGTPEYARHMQRQFDLWLMRRLPQKNVPVPEWEKFLRDSFAANKPWDQLVRQILSNDGSDPNNRGPGSISTAMATCTSSPRMWPSSSSGSTSSARSATTIRRS
ncbi:MAG: DUF1549 domain-containing protein, partial [Planctomycetaceae bacterium]